MGYFGAGIVGGILLVLAVHAWGEKRECDARGGVLTRSIGGWVCVQPLEK
jgi:hypothetical protein